jgi:hypothetical protein
MPNQTTTGPADWVREAIETAQRAIKADPRKTRIEEMIGVITDGIEVLQHRDGVPVTHGMARERARNILAVFVGMNWLVLP